MVRPSKPKKSHSKPKKTTRSPKRVLGLATFQPQDVGGIDYPARKKRKDRKLPPLDPTPKKDKAKTPAGAKDKTTLCSPIKKNNPIGSSKRAHKAEMPRPNLRATTPPSGHRAFDEDELARRMNNEPKHDGVVTRSRGMAICRIL